MEGPSSKTTVNNSNQNPNITSQNQEFLDAVKYSEVFLELGKTQADTQSKITLLLESGANINAKDKNGQTALHYASAANNHETFNFLLKRGADFEAKDNDGKTALHFAESNGHGVIVGMISKAAASSSKAAASSSKVEAKKPSPSVSSPKGEVVASQESLEKKRG